MNREKNAPNEGGLFGPLARWAAAPYCEFKDDRARLYALFARDVRWVAIVTVLAFTGASMPLRGWLSIFLG